MNRYLKILVLFLSKHSFLMLFLLLFPTLIGSFYWTKIQLRSNFSDLLPDLHPAVVESQKLRDKIGSSSFVVVTAEGNPDRAREFLHFLESRLQDHAGIASLDFHPPRDFIRQKGLLYLDIKTLEEIRNTLKKEVDKSTLEKTSLLIDFDDAPKNDRLSSFQKYKMFLDPEFGYQSLDGNLTVGFIKPRWNPSEIGKTGPFREFLEKNIDEASLSDSSIKVTLTGPYIKALDQQAILTEDIKKISLLSLSGSVLFLFVYFRKKRSVLLIGGPLIMGVLWTLTAAYFIYGSLNLFSSVVCSIVMGLAADYGIHLYSEYHHLRKTGQQSTEAMTVTLQTLWEPFLVSASTTAASFFVLALSEFKAFSETGIIAGCGILLSTLCFILVFPTLTFCLEKTMPEKTLATPESTLSMKQRDGWFLSKKGFVLSSILLVVPIVFSAAFKRTGFDYDLNKIMGEQKTRQLDRQVDGIFGHTVNPQVIYAESVNDIPKLVEALKRTTDDFRQKTGKTTIKGFVSYQDLTPQFQKEKTGLVSEIRDIFTPQVLHSMNAEEKEMYSGLKEYLHPSEISEQDIPAQLKTLFTDRQGRVGHMIYIFPNFDSSNGKDFLQFHQEISSLQCRDCEGETYLSGDSKVFYEIVRMLFDEGKYILGLSIFAVLVSLYLNFRNIRETMVVFFPLSLALLGTIAWMGLLEIPFNMINIATIPIILGICIDYFVHFHHRSKDPSVDYGQKSRPLIGSGVTTLIGFGSLLIANMGGVRSFGLTTSLALFICLSITLIWFPYFSEKLVQRK